MNSYLHSHLKLMKGEEQRLSHTLTWLHMKVTFQPGCSHLQSHTLCGQDRQTTLRQQRDRSNNDILQVMQKQNMITEMLVDQQKQAQLPVKEVTVSMVIDLLYLSF